MPWMILSFLLVLTGCAAYESEPIKTIMTDPHYSKYQDEMDALEKSYLAGEVSYPDYLTQKKELEEKYSKEVKEREDILHDHQPEDF